MNRFAPVALCAALIVPPMARCAASEVAAEAVEVHPRSGLPNFLSRIQAGLPVTVAFLGGSITQEGGYARKWVAALKKEYPRSKVTVVNAGVAGMSSRVGETVMAARPDLVFVEFAVNDGDQPEDHSAIFRAMEGIVRQVWQGSPLTDLCFVYHARPGATGIEALQAGKLPVGAVAHEKVAEYYGIPSVHLALAAARRVREGKLAWAPASGARTPAQVEITLDGVARVLPLANRAAVANGRPGVVILPIGRALADAPHTVALKALNPCTIGHFLVVGEPMGP